MRAAGGLPRPMACEGQRGAWIERARSGLARSWVGAGCRRGYSRLTAALLDQPKVVSRDDGRYNALPLR